MKELLAQSREGASMLALIRTTFLCTVALSFSAKATNQEALELADKYCSKNGCESTSLITETIKSPSEGTCIVLSRGTLFKEFNFDKSGKDWWLLVPRGIFMGDYEIAIEVVKKFSNTTHRQVYMAEPAVEDSFEAMVDNYCVVALKDLTFSYQKPIGLLIPKY